MNRRKGKKKKINGKNEGKLKDMEKERKSQ